MSWRIMLAFFLGLSVGNLPDHGVVWVGVKLAITFAGLLVALRVARREAA